MDNNRAVTEIISERYSCRSFKGTSIEPSQRKNLSDFIENNTVAPFGTKPRFIVFAATEKDNEALKGLGTYGFIKGASAFIVGASRPSEYNLEDYGYLMEKNILHATELGIGTCWVGGSFNKSVFSKKAQLEDGEYVPAVTAAGNAASKKRFVDSVVRLASGATKRKPFGELFFNKSFNTTLIKDVTGIYKAPLEMVQKAPSASNKQPWRIVCDFGTNEFHFYLQRTKKYFERNKKMFGLDDMQRIDMGIAMCHFELSANELDLKGEWKVENPDIEDLPEDTEYMVSWK